MIPWICDAIRHKRLASFSYEYNWFIVEPYLHGLRGDDVEILIGYTLMSSELDGSRREWKIFEAHGIQAHITHGDIIPFVRLGVPDVDLKDIYCKIE